MVDTRKLTKTRMVVPTDDGLDFILKVGKHKGASVTKVAAKFPEYVEWMLVNVDDLPVDVRTWLADLVKRPELAHPKNVVKRDECYGCRGTGKMLSAGNMQTNAPCSRCGGTGKFEKKRRGKARSKPDPKPVPCGVCHGTKKKLAGGYLLSNAPDCDACLGTGVHIFPGEPKEEDDDDDNSAPIAGKEKREQKKLAETLADRKRKAKW